MNEPNPEDRIKLLEQEVNEMRKLLIEVARKQSWPQYVDVGQLAEILGVSTRTIEGWVSGNLIPYHKVVGGTRFLLSEIVQWSAGKLDMAQRRAPAKRKGKAARKPIARDDKPNLHAV
jgi:excisionase family DNA binding protein